MISHIILGGQSPASMLAAVTASLFQGLIHNLKPAYSSWSALTFTLGFLLTCHELPSCSGLDLVKVLGNTIHRDLQWGAHCSVIIIIIRSHCVLTKMVRVTIQAIVLFLSLVTCLSGAVALGLFI